MQYQSFPSAPTTEAEVIINAMQMKFLLLFLVESKTKTLYWVFFSTVENVVGMLNW